MPGRWSSAARADYPSQFKSFPARAAECNCHEQSCSPCGTAKISSFYMPASSGRAAFQYPRFRYYMAARFLNVSSTEMQAVAVAWQVYGLTHRPLDLGLVGLAQFLPGILLFLVAGHTADRVPRKRILECCYGGFALCSALLL